MNFDSRFSAAIKFAITTKMLKIDDIIYQDCAHEPSDGLTAPSPTTKICQLIFSCLRILIVT